NLESVVPYEKTYPLNPVSDRSPCWRGYHDAERHRSTGAEAAGAAQYPTFSAGELPGGTPLSNAERAGGERGQGMVHATGQNPSRNRREDSQYHRHRWKKS